MKTTDNSEIITEAGFFDKLTAALASDPRSLDPTRSYQANLAAIQQNRQVGALADMLYNTWATRYMQLMRANGNQPLTDKNYKLELMAFIEDNLLPPYSKIAEMQNFRQINRAIDLVVQSRNDANILKKSFEQVIDQTAVARSKQASTKRSRPAANTNAQNAANTNAQNSAAQPQIPQNVSSMLSRVLNQRQQQQLLQLAGPNTTVNSTGNQGVDNLLRYLGLTIS